MTPCDQLRRELESTKLWLEFERHRTKILLEAIAEMDDELTYLKETK